MMECSLCCLTQKPDPSQNLTFSLTLKRFNTSFKVISATGVCQHSELVENEPTDNVPVFLEKVRHDFSKFLASLVPKGVFEDVIRYELVKQY